MGNSVIPLLYVIINIFGLFYGLVNVTMYIISIICSDNYEINEKYKIMNSINVIKVVLFLLPWGLGIITLKYRKLFRYQELVTEWWILLYAILSILEQYLFQKIALESIIPINWLILVSAKYVIFAVLFRLCIGIYFKKSKNIGRYFNS